MALLVPREGLSLLRHYAKRASTYTMFKCLFSILSSKILNSKFPSHSSLTSPYTVEFREDPLTALIYDDNITSNVSMTVKVAAPDIML